MDEKFTIKVNIAERYYPVIIARHDEEKVRKAARIITDKLQQYKEKKFADKDTQDLLAMVALQIATRLVELSDKDDLAPILERLELLDGKIKENLSSKVLENI